MSMVSVGQHLAWSVSTVGLTLLGTVVYASSSLSWLTSILLSRYFITGLSFHTLRAIWIVSQISGTNPRLGL